MSIGDVFKKIGLGALGAAVKVAPGGPVIGMVADALGLGAEATDEAIEAAIAADPEAVLKLKALEATHKETLQRIALEGTAAHLLDTQDARKRDIRLHELRGVNRRADVLAILAISGLIAVIFALFRFQPPPTAEAVLLVLAGSLAGIVTQVYNFEFGSSKGSKEKDLVRNGQAKGG